MFNESYRYARQVVLEGFGAEGQAKLQSSRILVVGSGGLGSPILLYLTAAGVGTVGIVDFDIVAPSNLNRQVLHFNGDLGKSKVESAETKLKDLNPEVNIIKFDTKLNIENVENIVGQFDIIIDATDNFTSRYLISDCCFFLKKPLVEGAAVGYDGIIMTIIPGKTPCYRCLYPSLPEDASIPTSSDIGILGAVAGVIGSMQALEAIKLAIGVGETISGRILTFDGLKSGFREVNWKKRDNCHLCGKEPKLTKLSEGIT